jgi:N-acyl-D-aspartate/D-glutamate deacylase
LFASTDELVALAAVAGRRDGIYATHMRSEGARLIQAIDEAIAIGRRAGIRVEIAHLKTSGRRNWGKLDQALERIEKARTDGVEVAADRYPYTASSTDLDAVFPAWAQEGGRDAVLGRLRDETDRVKLSRELARSRTDEEWGAITIGSTWARQNRRFTGMPLTEVARILRVDPVEAVLQLIEKDELRTGAFFFGMSEENMERILSQPYVMIGSDASIRAPTGPLSEDYPHPRAYGAFARFLRMALDARAVPIQEAVRKMTSLPASHYRLRDRGVLTPGAMADVVVIHPRTLCDFSTYAAPHRLAAGVEHVVVNGGLVIEAGRLTGRRSGRVLDA